MSIMTGISTQTFYDYGGPTGSATPAQINLALQLAWNQGEAEAGTQLYPYAIDSEPHPWPHNGRIMLDKSYLVAVTGVVAQHDGNTCDCDWTDVTGCSKVVDNKNAVIDVEECLHGTGCASCSCPGPGRGWGTMALVSYTAGLSSLDDSDKLALVLLAKEFLTIITTTEDEFAAIKEIQSWRSMDYSETYAKADAASPHMGANSRSELARKLLRRHRVKRAVDAFGNRPRTARIL